MSSTSAGTSPKVVQGPSGLQANVKHGCHPGKRPLMRQGSNVRFISDNPEGDDKVSHSSSGEPDCEEELGDKVTDQETIDNDEIEEEFLDDEEAAMIPNTSGLPTHPEIVVHQDTLASSSMAEKGLLADRRNNNNKLALMSPSNNLKLDRHKVFANGGLPTPAPSTVTNTNHDLNRRGAWKSSCIVDRGPSPVTSNGGVSKPISSPGLAGAVGGGKKLSISSEDSLSDFEELGGVNVVNEDSTSRLHHHHHNRSVRPDLGRSNVGHGGVGGLGPSARGSLNSNGGGGVVSRTGLWDEHQIAKSLEGIIEAAFAPAVGGGGDNSTRAVNNSETQTTAADDILALLEVFVLPTTPNMDEESASKANDQPANPMTVDELKMSLLNIFQG